MAVCAAPNCGRPTWDGQPGNFCSKSCRDGQKPVRDIMSLLKAGLTATQTCQAPGCGRSTFDGKPGFCSKRCRNGQSTQVAATALCKNPGCERPTFTGQPGYCSRSCRDSQKSAGKEASSRFPMSANAKVFEAFHGTTMQNADNIEEEGFLSSGPDHCLGEGVYVTEDKNKAMRFAFDRAAKRGGTPALVRCQVSVRNPLLTLRGDDVSWQAAAENYCSAYTTRTSLSTRSEWCIRDPGQVEFLQVEDLTGKTRPSN